MNWNFNVKRCYAACGWYYWRFRCTARHWLTEWVTDYLFIYVCIYLFIYPTPLPTNCRLRGLLSQLITFHDPNTLDRTPMDERSARRRNIYPTPHNAYKWQISMPPAGIERAIPACVGPQTHALDSASIAIGLRNSVKLKYKHSSLSIQKLHLQQPYSILILWFKADINFQRVNRNKFYTHLSFIYHLYFYYFYLL
jgi:hypothetical protein